MELVWVLLVAVAAATIAGLRLRRRDRRQRALLFLCREAGVTFSVLDPFGDTIFLPFRLFGRGEHRGFENVIWDPRDDKALRVFDYWVEEHDDQGMKVKQDLTCAVVPLPFGVPAVAVLPLGIVDVSREPAARRTVTLELDAFNRRFVVRTEDPRAAVAFLDQRMMEALVRIPLRVAIHVHEDRMLLVGPTLEPAEMLLLLEVARSLATKVPPVLASLYPPRQTEGPFEDRWLQGSWSPDPISADPNPTELGG
jgi:hypothetical protein